MHSKLAALLELSPFVLAAAFQSGPTPQEARESGSGLGPENPIRSELLRTDANELVLVQEVLVNAPVAAVWNSYVTEEGWTAWASPVAKIDLRAGGTIQTQYDPAASIGDPGTNTLHILNYVPERLLTLQADVSERWPAVMQEDAEHLMNVIIFESLGDATTRISSYGVGYHDSPAYDELMDFFIPANEGLFAKLKQVLES